MRSQSGRDDEPGRVASLERLVRRIGGIGPRCRAVVHLYLDVSGSVESSLDALFAAVRSVALLVSPDVHLFSTDVVDVPIRDLAKGTCQTTGGTSIAPVARHIREKRVRRAVIVTDGQVGGIGARDRETFGEMILGVALTSEREKAGELAGLARHLVVLPGLEPSNEFSLCSSLSCKPRLRQAASESDLRHAEEWLAARYPEWSKVAGPDAKSGKTAGATKKKGRS